MKKLLYNFTIIMLIAVSAVALVACGKKGNEDSHDPNADKCQVILGAWKVMHEIGDSEDMINTVWVFDENGYFISTHSRYNHGTWWIQDNGDLCLSDPDGGDFGGLLTFSNDNNTFSMFQIIIDDVVRAFVFTRC